MNSPPLLFAWYQVELGIYIDIDAGYRALTEKMKSAGFEVPNKMGDSGALFHQEDYQTTVFVSTGTVYIFTTDYCDAKTFSGILVKVLEACEEIAETKIIVKAISLGFLNGFEFDEQKNDGRTPLIKAELQGLKFQQNDHEHRTFEYWCDCKPSGRLDVKIKSKHATHIKPDPVETFGMAWSPPFEEIHKIYVYSILITMKEKFSPPQKIEPLIEVIQRYHKICGQTFSSCASEQGKKEWGYEEK